MSNVILRPDSSMYFKMKMIWIIILISLIATHINSQQKPSTDLYFKHLQTKDGLSSNVTSSILQDSHGFMWFGTDAGLNRYDGYNIKIFNQSDDSTHSLSNDVIKCLYEDESGIIWIGTDRGLNAYNPVLDKISKYLAHDDHPSSLSNNTITAITQHQNLWVGTFNGLNKLMGYDAEGQAIFRIYKHNDKDDNSLSNNRIYCLHTDKKGNIWIGTEGGGLNILYQDNDNHLIRRVASGKGGIMGEIIYTIHEEENGELYIGTELGINIVSVHDKKLSIQSYPHPQSTDAPIFSVTSDRDNTIWAGTFGEGLNYFDRNTRSYHSYKNDPLNTHSISRNFVYTVYESKEDILWIATRETGIDRLDPMVQRFKQIKHKANNKNSLSNNVVKAILEGPDGKIWIGTYGGGLNVYNPQNGTYKNYKHQANNSNSLSNNIIESLCFDHLNRLWIGTSNGLNCFDLKTNAFKRFLNSPNKSNSLTNNNIWSVYPSKDKKSIWIGTYDGLDNYNFETNTFTHFKNDPDDPSSLSFNFIRTVFEDPYNNLWICTWGGGLDRLDLSKNTNFNQVTFEHYQHHIDDSLSISNDLVNTIFMDNQDNYWVGTQYGLNKFNLADGNFNRLTAKDGLPGNVIKGILSDSKGYIWISTQSGLSKYNPISQHFSNYTQADGLQGNIFNLSSCLYKSSGEMYIGGNSGISVFTPEEITESESFPRLYLESLKVNNQKITTYSELNDRQIIKQSLFFQKTISLLHHENNLNFEFSAIELSAREKIKFKYKLEGADLQWNYATHNNRQITYSNLSPGIYYFKVHSTNLNGDWNEQGISTQIIIKPPFWASNYAYTLYGILLIIGIISLYRITKRKQRIKHERLRLEEEHKQKLELEQFKIQFFTNISHEIRTPLTLIAGPLEKLLSEKDKATIKEQKKSLLTIDRNVQILLRLVNQLLDFRKIENKKINIAVESIKLSEQLKTLASPFDELISKKELSLTVDNSLSNDNLMVPIDQDKLEKIVYNLLSNAIKFTPEKGHIGIHLYGPGEKRHNDPSVNSNDYICFSVSDSGIGIPKEKQDYIFERFTQIHNPKQFQTGTGIGLSYTKALITSHKGYVTVESIPNEGSTFFVWLPVKLSAYTNNEIIKEKGTTVMDVSNEQPAIYLEEKTANNENTNTDSSLKPTILIVEDNKDMRSFIYDTLKDKYQLLEAENGKVGLELALAKGPDLIISDIMMPVMDGLEFCKKVKQNINISHTPVVLLTAKNTLIDEMQGLDLGADQYIAKPFNIQRLKLIIRNLLDARKKLQNKFNAHIIPEPQEISVTSADERFFEKLTQLLEENISNSELTVEYLAEKTGMSSVHLYRKLKSITGMSSSKYVRSFRLKRASQLLLQNKLRISEVAYMVGFTDPKYFRKCFKEEFGVSPSAYIENEVQ